MSLTSSKRYVEEDCFVCEGLGLIRGKSIPIVSCYVCKGGGKIKYIKEEK